MNNYYNNNLWYNNLNILINLKENESVILDDNYIKKDERYITYLRKTENLKELNYVIKKSFLSIIINIQFKKSNLIKKQKLNDDLFTSLHYDEELLNNINYINEAGKGLLRLLNYYKNYKIKDFNLIEKTYYKIINIINNLDNIEIKLKNCNKLKKYNDNEISESKQIYTDNLINSYYLEEGIIKVDETNDTEETEEDIEIEMKELELEELEVEEEEESTIDNQPFFYNINYDCTIIDDYNYDLDNDDINIIDTSYNNYYNNNQLITNHCYTIPVFYSINDITKNIKNAFVKIFVKLYNSIIEIF